MKDILNIYKSNTNYILWICSAVAGCFLTQLVFVNILAWFSSSQDIESYLQASRALAIFLPFVFVALLGDSKGCKVGVLATIFVELASRAEGLLFRLKDSDDIILITVLSLLAMSVIVKILVEIAGIQDEFEWIFGTCVLVLARLFWHLGGGTDFIGTPAHHINTYALIIYVVLGTYGEYRSSKEEKQDDLSVIVYSENIKKI